MDHLPTEIVDSLPPSPGPPHDSKHSRLIALLSNPSFMNGPKGKPSIWTILENFHRSTPANSHINSTTTSPTYVQSEIQPSKDLPPESSSSNVYTPNESSASVYSDTSSIMVYSPLFPTQSDFVELAELVPFDAEPAEQDVLVNSNAGEDGHTEITQQVVGGGTSWTLMWPLSTWYRRNQPQQSISQALSSSMGLAPATSPQIGSSSPTTPRITTVKSQKNIRAWVPSQSKISVQAFWWGYRLYLPPLILETLSDKSLEAAKRSAVITTALTWFFNNLPIDVFPPPLKPGLILLQRLVPIIGYIGTFISWSWSTIRSYDVGYGVTLTATWILPLALIPGTWHERDFPKSPLPNSPIPLPQSPPFSMHSLEPTMSTTTMTDDIPTSAYATPMSSVVLSSPFHPVPNTVLDEENGIVDPSLTSSPTAWSASPSPSHPPLLSPIHYPPTTPPNAPTFTPNSPTTITHHPVPVPLTPNSSTHLPSPRIRTPRFSTRMRPLSPSISSNSTTLTIHNTVPLPPPSPTPLIPTSTPIPMPPTPIELPPIPPEPPFSPKLVNQLLRGPVLQTVPLPDVD